MNLLFWGLTLSTLGKVLLAIGVLLAHHKVAEHHRIDGAVIRSFHREKWITLLGLLLILFGYAVEITFYGFTPFYECPLTECASDL